MGEQSVFCVCWQIRFVCMLQLLVGCVFLVSLYWQQWQYHIFNWFQIQRRAYLITCVVSILLYFEILLTNVLIYFYHFLEQWMANCSRYHLLHLIFMFTIVYAVHQARLFFVCLFNSVACIGRYFHNIQENTNYDACYQKRRS